MDGETDLQIILANLTVSRRPGTFVVANVGEPVAIGDGVEAVLAESEGVTVVAAKDVADRNGWEYGFEAHWLTINVHSSLSAVGLTAEVSRALAAHGIAANVLAGFYHDHILVPSCRVGEAIAVLETLSEMNRPSSGSMPPPRPKPES